MANFGGQRELWVAAPVNTVDTNTTATDLTITASEPLQIDLDRLVIQMGKDGASEEESPNNDFVNAATITSVLVRNSIQLIRGRNTVTCPAGAFSGTRGIPSGVNWGAWQLETGDTITVSLILNGTVLSTSASLGAPCLPNNSRGANPPTPTWNPTYSGSPTETSASADTVTATFDADGLVDLDSLLIKASQQSDAANVQGMQVSVEASTGITSLQLPSGDALIIGQNTPSAPMTAFGPGRSFTWARFGLYEVSAGSTITMGITPAAIGNKVESSLAFRFYPHSGPANRGY